MELGFVGLGRMGGNMVTRLVRGGHKILAYDPSPNAAKLAEANGAALTTSLGGLRQAGRPARGVGDGAGRRADGEDDPGADRAPRPGRHHHRRRQLQVEGRRPSARESSGRKGIHYVDAGTSGGVWGLQNGYCLMVGGDKRAGAAAGAVFKTLGPPDGWMHVGAAGAGHYVKMIHNGIEYAMMQAYAEGFELMSRVGVRARPAGHRQALDARQRGALVAARPHRRRARRKIPKLSALKPWVEDSGEGRWTVDDAVEKAVPAPTITASLFARFRSRRENSFADRLLAAMRNQFGGHAVRR